MSLPAPADPGSPEPLVAHAGGGDARICASCGRRMPTPRRRNVATNAVRYCSRACRTRRIRSVDRRLEAAILELLAGRDRGASICPSEAARAVDAQAWRDLMEPARRAARRLVHGGAVEILQRGRAVDPCDFRGPIRIRARR